MLKILAMAAVIFAGIALLDFVIRWLRKLLDQTLEEGAKSNKGNERIRQLINDLGETRRYLQAFGPSNSEEETH